MVGGGEIRCCQPHPLPLPSRTALGPRPLQRELFCRPHVAWQSVGAHGPVGLPLSVSALVAYVCARPLPPTNPLPARLTWERRASLAIASRTSMTTFGPLFRMCVPWGVWGACESGCGCVCGCVWLWLLAAVCPPPPLFFWVGFHRVPNGSPPAPPRTLGPLPPPVPHLLPFLLRRDDVGCAGCTRACEGVSAFGEVAV